ANYMLENQQLQVSFHEGTPLSVDLPPSVELTITHTEPGLQGDRSTGGSKPATLETGYEIQVPLFLDEGTAVKVDTRSGDYLGRVKTVASARTRARRSALELLFEAGQRRLAMDERVAMRSNDPDYPMKEYTVEIVSGITERQSEIDEIISTYAQGWTLDRMPAVDRSLLEIGTCEILFNDDVPDKVAIDEAVSLARPF